MKAAAHPVMPRVTSQDADPEQAIAFTRIRELMDKAEPERCTLDWLARAVQSAISLEFATLPPYLTALWSIKAEMSSAAVSIREVVQEEMQHMGSACNLLKAIGGKPQIAGKVPTYPMLGLPGGVMPNLMVNIAGLSHDSLKTFMVIEHPEIDVITGQRPEPVQGPDEFASIGEFYDEIVHVLDKLDPSFTLDGQVIGPRTGPAINNLKSAKHVIAIIKEQGEGSSTSPIDFSPDDFSHYYRFAELRAGRKIVQTPPPDKKWIYSDTLVPFPEVWPVADLPRGGYDLDRVTGSVIHLLDKFDDAYTTLIDDIQSTWDEGDQAIFLRSIEAMFQMQEYALALMRIPRYDGKGNYVPRWRYVQH